MPSRISLFFRRDRTKSGPSDTDDTRRSKVRKRLSLFSSDIREPSQTETPASENASPPTIPRPRRSIRASTANVPELPSYPIYQTFNPSRHLSLLPDERPRDDAPCTDRRPTRIASVADFQALRRRHSRRHLDRVAAISTEADKLPAYDRAAELGTFYRSILPDFQAMWDEEEVRETGDGQPVVNQQHTPQTQHNTCPHIATEEEQEATRSRDTPSTTHLEPPPNPTRNAPSVASSTTAVDSDDHTAIPPPRQREIETRPQPQGNNNAGPPPAPEPSPEPTTPSPPPIPQRHRDRRSRIIQPSSSTIGLQICTELLTAQLRTALSLNHHREQPNSGNGSEQSQSGQEQPGDNDEREPKQKLQVLLLIEAYEGVLRRCRREMMSLALGMDEAADGDGGGGDAAREERRRMVGEAVPILEHWLDVLHAVCDGEFVGEGVED